MHLFTGNFDALEEHFLNFVSLEAILWHKVYAVMILQSTGIKITRCQSLGPGVLPP